MLDQAREVLTGVQSMSTAVQPQGDTELTGPIGSHRVVAWADAALSDVKKVRAELGGTVNDVVLATITNGFRKLLLARGETVDGRAIKTLVPVSVRATRDDGAATGDGTLSNKVSTMFASLPVGIADPAERLAAVRDELDRAQRVQPGPRRRGAHGDQRDGSNSTARPRRSSRRPHRRNRTHAGTDDDHERAGPAVPAVLPRAQDGPELPLRPGGGARCGSPCRSSPTTAR